ncbi:MAG: 3-phosphoshikimate 1-carboxyvinyltransferase [Nitrosopumilales archaeon]|nr:3-phosphoshikimate 1-carboxyvinyltransferase [Nitrosopumilales archaeon]
MNCKVEKTKISGTLVCPPNKSYTHRAIFLASLADGKSVIKNVLYSRDTNATISTCKSFGATIIQDNSSLTVNGIKEVKSPSKIDASNSGTTIRVAAAIAALGKGKTVLSGDESLRQRPMQPLLDALESIGAKCSSANGKPPISITGKISGGEITIPGNISSQFVSALMIMSPLTENGLVLNIDGDLVSKPYLDATITSMKKFGVTVKTVKPYKNYIISQQKYKPTAFTVPSDFSSLAMLLSASILLGDNITIKTTIDDLPQADKAIFDILKSLGIIVNIEKDNVTVQSQKPLNGGKFDLSNSPDLLPPLAILSLKSSKPIHIFNVKHARYKETDRIAILARELKKLGVSVEEKEDGLILESTDKLHSADLNSENDHRLFMAFCIAGMYVGNCTVSNPESIDVSYPNFISDLKRVGGKILLS